MKISTFRSFEDNIDCLNSHLKEYPVKLHGFLQNQYKNFSLNSHSVKISLFLKGYALYCDKFEQKKDSPDRSLTSTGPSTTDELTCIDHNFLHLLDKYI